MIIHILRGSPRIVACLALLGAAALPSAACADEQHDALSPIRADGHAPIGVMGDHLHKKGEYMFSYRYMRMDMEGNRIGTDSVSPQTIVTTQPNRFFGTPGQPPTLRVVPTEMTMDMHMFGMMFAPSDNVTLMFMLPFVEKSMDHITFAGGMGTSILGGFTTESEGLGDPRVTALVRLWDRGHHHLHANLGLSLPAGSITQTGRVLAPNGMMPTLRLPYAMQLGTGTFDALPGLTYTGRRNDLSWGLQYRASIPLEDENDQGYRWGDKHGLTGWLAYEWAPWISTSLRADAVTQDAIHGIDPRIVAPVQTADPDNYGGDRVDLALGVNLVGQRGLLRGHRLAFEIAVPVYQDLNGPQMETDIVATVGWQKAF